jgi:hypothetical protein
MVRRMVCVGLLDRIVVALPSSRDDVADYVIRVLKLRQRVAARIPEPTEAEHRPFLQRDHTKSPGGHRIRLPLRPKYPQGRCPAAAENSTPPEALPQSQAWCRPRDAPFAAEQDAASP